MARCVQIFISLSLLMTACGESTPSLTLSSTAGPSWTLQSIDGVPIAPEESFAIDFATDESVAAAKQSICPESVILVQPVDETLKRVTATAAGSRCFVELGDGIVRDLEESLKVGAPYSQPATNELSIVDIKSRSLLFTR